MADIVSLLKTVSTALNDFSVAPANARIRNLHGQTAIVATKEILDILNSNTTKALKNLWDANPEFADPAVKVIIHSIDDSGQGISETLEHKLHLLKRIAHATTPQLLPDDTAIAAQLVAIGSDTSLPARQIRTSLQSLTHFRKGIDTGITNISHRTVGTQIITTYSHANPNHQNTIDFNNSFGELADLVGIAARHDKERVVERIKNDAKEMRRIYKEQFFPEMEEYLKLEKQLKKLKHYNLLDFSAPTNWHPVAQNIVLKIRSGLLYLDKIPLLRPFHRIGQLMAFFDKDRHELENISARLVDMETKFTMDIMPAMRKCFASIALCDKSMYRKVIGDLCREDPEFFLFQDKGITGKYKVELDAITNPVQRAAKERLLKQQLKAAGIEAMMSNFEFRQSSEGQTQGYLPLDIVSQMRFKEMEAGADSEENPRASLFERLFHDAPAKTAGMMQKYFVNGDPHLNVGAFQHFAGQRMLTNIHEAERLINPLRYTVNSRTQGFHLNQNSRKDNGLWLAKKFCRLFNNRKENQEEVNNLSYVFKQQYRQLTQPLGFITKPIVSLLNLTGLAAPLRSLGLIRNNELMLPGLRSIQGVLPFKEKSSLQGSLDIDYDYFMGVRVFDAFHRYREFTTTWSKQSDTPTPGQNLASAAEDLKNAIRDSFILAAQSNKAPSSAVCRRFLGQGQNSESPKQWGEIYAAIAKEIRIPYELARKPASRLDTRMPTPADLNPYSDKYEPYGYLVTNSHTGEEEWAFKAGAKQQFEKQLAKSEARADELKEGIDKGSKQAQQIVNELFPMINDYVEFLKTQPQKEAINYTPIRTTPSPHASTTRYLELPNNAAVQKTEVADLITIALNEARRSSLSNDPQSLEARNNIVPLYPLVRAMREHANTY
jgi:hypothetical protein